MAEGLKRSLAEVNAINKQANIRTEGKDLFGLIVVFVGQFLNDGKDILFK